MSMKLSYRDKVIIIVVSVLVVLGVGIFCFAKPKYEDLQVAKERLAAKEDEKAQVEAKMGTLEGLKKQLEESVDAVVKDQEKFLSEKEYGETYQISKYLMELFSPVSGFEITGVTMDALESTDLALGVGGDLTGHRLGFAGLDIQLVFKNMGSAERANARLIALYGGQIISAGRLQKFTYFLHIGFLPQFLD